MNIKTTSKPETKNKILVMGIFEEEHEKLKDINPVLFQEIEEAIKNKTYTKEFGKTYSTKITNSAYERILAISLGKKKDINAERIRRSLSKAAKYTNSHKSESFTTNISSEAYSTGKFDAEQLGIFCAEGILLSNYSFTKYRTKKTEENALKEASLQWTDYRQENQFKKGIKKGTIISEATNYAKDLVNEPASTANIQYLENEAKKLAKQSKKIKLKSIHEKDLKKLGLNAILAVGKGSVQPPKLIILEYKTGKGKTTALVGKGVTFDSGGYNIKPTGYMEEMKSDMSGAAAVLGTIKAISTLDIKTNIIALIPLCENMVSGNAFRPGDIIKTYSGKTVEIGNTDAEGRLILADAIAYAEKNYNPEKIIDIATLTGACTIALGFYASGLIGNDEKLNSDIETAGTESYDRVWRLPFFEEYHDIMDGDITDLSSMTKKGNPFYAGAITAAVFLSKFVNKAKWAHIDIAGTAYLKEAKEYNQKYASGAGVRLLTYYLMKEK